MEEFINLTNEPKFMFWAILNLIAIITATYIVIKIYNKFSNK